MACILQMKDDQKDELEKLNAEHKIEMNKLETEYKRKRDATLEEHDV